MNGAVMGDEAPISNSYQFKFTSDGRVYAADRTVPIGPESFYYVGDEKIMQMFGASLPSDLADFIDIVLAVYIADRLARRRQPRSDRYQLHWSRKIHICLPVRDPVHWQNDRLKSKLQQVLAFFTDDEWTFEFVDRRTDSHRSAVQARLFRIPMRLPAKAALFSGGLDSFAGLCRDLNSDEDGSIVLVCAGTNSRTINTQQKLLAAVRSKAKHEVVPVIVPFGLRGPDRRHDHEERSQRSRGFVYQALGAVVGTLAGVDSLAIYENGIGSINLPYTAAQLGTQSSRATHPVALLAMGDLVTLATGRPFTFRLPFLLATKAQLCATFYESRYSSLISETVSCDGFPVRVVGHPQCGLCTSCLLRRQALHAAG